MSKFFISYSHRDKAFAFKLRTNILRVDNAHEVFLDRFGLGAGTNIKAELAKKIEWCDYFILILSNSSLKSKWVEYELKQARKCERKTGEKKLFAVVADEVDLSSVPRALTNDLTLDFSVNADFCANFFRLMHGIYQKPTFYEIKHEVRNDPDAAGYLATMWVESDPALLNLIELVEYRFDYEFNDTVDYNYDEVIDGAVHTSDDRQRRFEVRDLYISESITAFVGLYLKNTKVIFFRVFIEVGGAAN